MLWTMNLWEKDRITTSSTFRLQYVHFVKIQVNDHMTLIFLWPNFHRTLPVLIHEEQPIPHWKSWFRTEMIRVPPSSMRDVSSTKECVSTHSTQLQWKTTKLWVLNSICFTYTLDLKFNDTLCGRLGDWISNQKPSKLMTWTLWTTLSGTAWCQVI